MLEAVSLSKTFPGKHRTVEALKPLTLSFAPRTVSGIVGPSGSGKSTLLHLLSGLLTPTSGQVLFDGADISRWDDTTLSRFRGTQVQYIPQGQSLLQNLSVLENLLLPFQRYPRETDGQAEALSLLEVVGLADYAYERPEHLSGGELRRVSILRALLNKPQYILADEPTSDLDRENTEIVVSLLRQAAAEGIGVILVTHDPSILREEDTVYRLEHGVLQA